MTPADAGLPCLDNITLRSSPPKSRKCPLPDIDLVVIAEKAHKTSQCVQ